SAVGNMCVPRGGDSAASFWSITTDNAAADVALPTPVGSAVKRDGLIGDQGIALQCAPDEPGFTGVHGDIAPCCSGCQSHCSCIEGGNAFGQKFCRRCGCAGSDLS